jgi:2-isopropylmalate synthase
VECTVNGIGERAGNTSMEEVVMAIKTRRDRFAVDTGIVTEQLYPTSRLLAQVTGIPIPINKPIVGDNAFAHEAGIHQDGVLKHRLNYEIMTPESVGLDSNRIVLGKHSGRHAFVARLRELGLELGDLDMNRAFERFKALADAKKNVYDEDLIALVAQESTRDVRDRYELIDLSVTSSTAAVPHAAVRLRIDGKEVRGEGTGDGMVDACYKVISDLTGQHPQLQRYVVKAITGGTDAQGEVSGSHTDIVQASALAYVNALNKLEYRRQYRQQLAEVGP